MLHFRSLDIGMFGRRQRHARGHRIPVTIVRGGGEPASWKVNVFVDSFGPHDVAPIAGVCTCCTVRVRLQNALAWPPAERAMGNFTPRVVLDTRENLAPILRTFVTERALGAEFYVEGDLPDNAFGSDALGIERFVLSERTAIPWETFSRFMTTLIALRGADLLHIKGTLDIVGCAGPVEVLFMGHLAARPVELQAWPDEDRASLIAFSTRNIPEKFVRDLFDSVRALAAPPSA
jgi:hypothetical protein